MSNREKKDKSKSKKLQLNKETLKDMTAKGARQVKGGFGGQSAAGCNPITVPTAPRACCAAHG